MSLFTISLFEWMASLRLDDYWFATLETILTTVDQLPSAAAQWIMAREWEQLAAALGTDGKAPVHLEVIFYKTQGAELTQVRTRSFLFTLKDKEYQQLYLYL
jgi:hypothetical protein